MKISYINLGKKIKEMKAKKESKKNNNNIDSNDLENIEENENDNKVNLKNIAGNLRKTPKKAYTLLLFMIALLVITAKMNLDTYKNLSKEDYNEYTLDNIGETKPVNNDNVIAYQETASSIIDMAPSGIPVTSKNVTETKKDIVEEEKFVYEYQYLKPIEGTTSKAYSMDKVVYSKTLDMWKVHDGLDISCGIGTKVIASEKGVVERIYEDSFYGISIIIDHQNGIKTVYRNLDKDVLVKENEKVTKGQEIAKVGNSSSGESKDETHIHFEVIQNGEIVNPSILGIK